MQLVVTVATPGWAKVYCKYSMQLPLIVLWSAVHCCKFIKIDCTPVSFLTCTILLASSPDSPIFSTVHEKKRGSLVCKIMCVTSPVELWKNVLATRFLAILLDLSYSLNPLCRKNETLRSAQPMIQFLRFYHGSMGDVTHVILRTRLPLFSRVQLKRSGSLGMRLLFSIHYCLDFYVVDVGHLCTCLLVAWPGMGVTLNPL